MIIIPFEGIITTKMIRKNLVAIFLMISLFLLGSQTSGAVSPTPSISPTQEASPTATITPRPTESPREPLDQPTQDRLQAALKQQEIGPLSPTNFLKHAIRLAIDRGVPTNTIVLVLLLPLIGAVVGALHYLVGLTGFGVFMPAMIAVSFLATGVVGGLILFAMILLLTLMAMKLLRQFKLHYWPRRAITLWVVSLGTFGLLLLAPSLRLFDLTRISIFPILFMILLSEEFVRVQLGKSRKEAVRKTVGTLVLSIVGAVAMSWPSFQEAVILHPEVSLLTILLISVLVGRYTGFRLLEYQRFKSVLRR